MNIVLTGRAVDPDGTFVERNILVARINRIGWSVQSAVDYSTDVLVAADAALDRGTRKVQAARERGLQVWPYLRLFNRIATEERERYLPEFRVHVPAAPGPRTPTRDYPSPTGRLARNSVPAFQEIEPPPPWYAFSRYIAWRTIGWMEGEFDLAQNAIEECELFVQYQAPRGTRTLDYEYRYRACTLNGWHDFGDNTRWMLHDASKSQLTQFLDGMMVSVQAQKEVERLAREEREAEEERERIEAMTFRPKILKRQLGFD